MITYGQKYGRIDNCYCGNDNDNKILVASIFGMTMLTTAMILITKKVIVMRTEKNHYKYCCTLPVQPKSLMSSRTSSGIKEG